METRKILKDIFTELRKRYNPNGWWPAETSFEIAVGAILTQNTNWNNVEKALSNLKILGVLSPEHLYKLDDSTLIEAIRPAGFYTRKSKVIKEVSRIFKSLLVEEDTLEIRKKLLSIKGIGKETADSIILYAFEKPMFVVDAYTLRFLKRYGFHNPVEYDHVQAMFHNAFPGNVPLFKDFHAVIVEHAKALCRKKPDCKNCFLIKCKRATDLGAL